MKRLLKDIDFCFFWVFFFTNEGGQILNSTFELFTQGTVNRRGMDIIPVVLYG